MIQQIKLYRPDLNPEQNSSYLIQLTIYLTMTLLLILLISLMLYFEIDDKKLQRLSRQQELNKISASIQKLKQQFPDSIPNHLLITELNLKQTNLIALSQINKTLFNRNDDIQSGFSGYFSDMASINVPEIWLDHILINAEKKQIALTGKTRKTAKIPVFIKQIAAQTHFKGKTFASLELKQMKQLPQLVTFSVSSFHDSETQNKP